MKNKLIKCFVCCILLLAASKTYAQNNPYVDDRIVHYGWFLGGEILSYDFRGPAAELGGAFTVGGIIDLKLAKYLSLRFLPSINFGALNYYGNNVITTPLCLPLYIKWTASREMNIRPYVTVGAGIQVEMIKTSRKSSLYPTGIKFMARAFLFSMVQNKGKKVCLWDN